MSATRILVISNCQADIIALVLRFAIPGSDCATLQISQLADEAFAAQLVADCEGYDRIFHLDIRPWIHPDSRDRLSAILAEKGVQIPPISFNGFHPDICALQVRDGMHVASPTAFYHSLICLAGHFRGLGEADILACYNALVYSRLGYFENFAASREAMFAEFDTSGLDIRAEFDRWTRRGVFMYTPTHPYSFVVESMVRQACRKAGIDILDAPFGNFFPDNLAFDVVLPVYPEIARRAGVEGSYAFKPSTLEGHRVLGLGAFIAESCRIYRNLSLDDIILTDRMRGAMAVLEDWRPLAAAG